MTPLVFALVFAVLLVAQLRWLRVAQREHYIPGSATRFVWRWYRSSRLNITLAAALVSSCIATSLGLSPLLIFVAASGLLGPFGLGLRGRTSRLKWTRRMRALAGVVVFLNVIALVVMLASSAPARVIAWSIPLAAPLVDAALSITAPFERRLARRFVAQAVARLNVVRPRVVAITGSYGKTTTKGYIAHLLRETFSVLASPASFNNTAGLSRTINEHLSPETDVFVAEMGTYGLGEIREMCSWLKPEIAVITAIGPVHLERMRTIDRTIAAKSEILESATTAVLNIDYPGMQAAANSVAESRRRVLRCSESQNTDIHIDARRNGGAIVVVNNEEVGAVPPGVAPGNVACAVGAAVALDVPLTRIAAALPSLPNPRHRLETFVTDNGVTVLDDTYNSNPRGADRALSLLSALDADVKAVVTPGMVELGPQQSAENESLGARAGEVADYVVVVGRTNAAALVRGAVRGKARVLRVARREDAVRWVREHLGAGAAVVYENDLPDHYP